MDREQIAGQMGAGATVAPPGAAERDAGGRAVRERTLEAARSLFAEKGYAAASTRDLARAVGVTVPGLYYHFGSKMGILVTLVEEDLRGRRAAVERGLAAGASHRERLEAALSGLMEFHARRGGMPGVVMHDPKLRTDVELRGLVEESERGLRELLAELLREGALAGELRLVDPVQTAALLLASVRAVHLLRCFRQAGADAGADDAGMRGGAGEDGSRPAQGERGADDGLAAGMLSLLLHGLIANGARPGEGGGS